VLGYLLMKGFDRERDLPLERGRFGVRRVFRAEQCEEISKR
jgi:hypothetical protein